jgi:hypothetical protein
LAPWDRVNFRWIASLTRITQLGLAEHALQSALLMTQSSKIGWLPVAPHRLAILDWANEVTQALPP